jgi:DNA-binding response OmpR family regulator
MTETTKQKVLIVEDDTLLSGLLGRKLAQTYEVAYAPTGEAALALLANDKPALVLLDILLPGMDGFEVLRHIKADSKNADVHVVILSNLGEDEQVAKGKELGADRYVVKVSLTLDDVVDLVGSVLRKSA